MIKFLFLAFLFPVVCAVEIPPIERAFRFLVVDDQGKPADGVPFLGVSVVEDGKDPLYGGRTSKEVMRKIIISANGGEVEIPKHTFTHFQVSINTDKLKESSVWMVD